MPSNGSRWSLGGRQGWVAPSYQQLQQDRNRREIVESEGARIARLNHDERQLRKVRQVERQASRAALNAESAELSHALLAPRPTPGLYRSRSAGHLSYGLGQAPTSRAGAIKQAGLVREHERLELERIELERERNRLRERAALGQINSQRIAVQADTQRTRRLSATRRLNAAPQLVAVGPARPPIYQTYAPSPTSLVPAYAHLSPAAGIPALGVPGLRRTASFNSGLIRPGMRNSLHAPVALAAPVVPLQQRSGLIGGRPRVNSMGGLSPRLRPVQLAGPAPAPVVNYNTYHIQPEHHDLLGLPAQVSHLNLSPRAMPLHSFGGGPHVQRIRRTSFGSYGGGGSPGSFGSSQQWHSVQNSPRLGAYGGEFGGAYVGPPAEWFGADVVGAGGGLGGLGGAAAYAEPAAAVAPQQEFVFTDETTYPGRQLVQELGEVQGFSNLAAQGEDPLDAAIKSLVANAQMMGANGVLSMDVSEDQAGNVVVRGIAVVLA